MTAAVTGRSALLRELDAEAVEIRTEGGIETAQPKFHTSLSVHACHFDPEQLSMPNKRSRRSAKWTNNRTSLNLLCNTGLPEPSRR